MTGKIKLKKCKLCDDGHHQSGNLRCNSLCTCWCRTGEFTTHVPFRPTPALPTWRWPDLAPVLSELRSHGVVCRTSATGALLFKPKPSELPEAVGELIRENRLVLTFVLAAEKDPSQKQRHYWTHGGLRACVGCGRLTLLIDPLGEHRHYWCGWVRQLTH